MVSEQMTELFGWPVKRLFELRADGVHWTVQIPSVPNQEGCTATLEAAENAAVAAAKATIENLPAFEFSDVAPSADGSPHSYRARYVIFDEATHVHLEVDGLAAPVNFKLKQAALQGMGADPHAGVRQGIRTFANRIVKGEIIPD